MILMMLIMISNEDQYDVDNVSNDDPHDVDNDFE